MNINLTEEQAEIFVELMNTGQCMEEWTKDVSKEYDEGIIRELADSYKGQERLTISNPGWRSLGWGSY